MRSVRYVYSDLMTPETMKGT